MCLAKCCMLIHLSLDECSQMRAQQNIDSLLSEASSSDVMSHHGTVLAMHLMNYGKNFSRFRQHVQQLYDDGISCLAVHCEAVVSVYDLCAIVLLYFFPFIETTSTCFP